MSTDRIAIVESNLDHYLETARAAPRLLAPEDPLRPGSGLTARKAIELFEDQCLSRAIDVAARALKKRDLSYYTISSAGHEMNVVLGAMLELDDPCFLHYRAGAFMMARSRKDPVVTPTMDTLLSICAAAEEPISGGRHKVWGSKRLWVPPQTSTIASQLPKAVGMAFAIARARRLHIECPVSRDAIVCCSFGDASVNHATALAGINSARYARMFGNPMPILFLCEDNRRGISVETPRSWVPTLFAHSPDLRFFDAVGQIDEIWDVAAEAVETCRTERVPVFLRLQCQRLWGHAGSDVETSYRTKEEIETTESKDSILRTARRLVEMGAAAPESLQAILHDTRERVAAVAEEAAPRPKLESRAQVIEVLAPYDEGRCRARASEEIDLEQRREILRTLPEETGSATRRTLAAHVNSCLADLMIRHPEILILGEDVGRKGGVYNLTAGLQKKFGRARVFDTLLDETTILGTAQGAAQLGFLPVPEIQYLAYVHNAIDQLRGEACSLSFFSRGQFLNPMVVRIAAFAYQRGFGGHFHNDNSIGALRDIPGLVLAAPSRGDDAARMLRGAVAMALECGRVVCFLEPIALYHQRDLYEEKDGLWLSDYPKPGRVLLPGEVGVYAEKNTDLLLVSYANGLRLALRAARELEREHGIRARSIDLRWLNPLPTEAIAEHAAQCGATIVVDECRATGGGIADAVIASLSETGYGKPLRSVRSADTYVPLGPAANEVLVRQEDITACALEVLA